MNLRVALLAATVFLMRTGDALAQEATTECPASAVSTTGWLETPGFAVGASLRHPASYVRQVWEVVSDSTQTYLLLRKDDALQSRVEIESSTRSAMLWRDRSPTDRECTIPTQSGPMPALIGRRKYSGYSGGIFRTDSAFVIRMLVADPGTKAPVVFQSFAQDSMDFVVHLAIARTVKLLSAPDGRWGSSVRPPSYRY